MFNKNIIIAKLYYTYYLIFTEYNKIRYYLLAISNMYIIIRLAKLRL